MTPETDPHLTGSAVLARYRDVALVSAVSIWGLYAAQGVLVPLALAVLAFVLITAVADTACESWGVPRWMANLIGVTAVLAGILGIGYVLTAQAASFARTVTSYETEFDAAAARLLALIGPEAAQAIGDMIAQIDTRRWTFWAVDGARSFLSTFLLICLYVAFMMAERRVMAHKILLAAADEKLGCEIATATRAISLSLQRYVSVKTSVSILTGGISYVIFKLIGIEFPETWALITFALNFIPSIGSVIAVLFPAAFALLQFETLGPFFLILFGCGTIQFLIGNLLDPTLMGRSLNLSTFMVILALTFWGTVWGLLGAFLSVPLTVCLLIVFSHIPAMRPLAILLSKDGQIGRGPPG